MAKSAPAPAAPAAAAKPEPAHAAIGAAGVAKIQSIADERAEDVVHWGNGEPLDGAPPAMARDGNLADAKPTKVEPQRGEPDHPDELAARGAKDDHVGGKNPDPEDEGDAGAEAAVVETSAEKRERALAALGAERRARSLEAELKKERDARQASEKMTLGQLMKARGVNKDELLEKLLTGTDDLGLPAKLEGDAATLAALTKRLDEAEAKLKDRDAREEQRQIQDGVRIVEQTLREAAVPLPLIDGLGKYEDVMNEAYRRFVDAGSEGSALDHLPHAAEAIEKKLRKENPRLAALADAATKGKSTPAAAAEAVGAGAPRAGITRRVAARPDRQPAPLPMDTQDRDAAIKREFGFVDRA